MTAVLAVCLVLATVTLGAETLAATGASVVLLIDNSASTMLPDRDALTTLVRTLGPSVIRWAIVSFDSSASVLLPMTTIADSEGTRQFRDILMKLDGRGRFTDLAAGFEAAVDELERDTADGTRIVLAYTDGVADMPGEPNAALVSTFLERVVPVLIRLNAKVITSVPPRSGANLVLLDSLATATRGVCLVGGGTRGLATVMRELSVSKRAPAATPSTVPVGVGSSQRLWIPIFGALILLLLGVGYVAVKVSQKQPRASAVSVVPERPAASERPVVGQLVAEMRALAAGLGETGERVRQLAASVEDAGAASWQELQDSDDVLKRILARAIEARDQVLDLLEGISTEDVRNRENLEFVDELLQKLLKSAGVTEYAVQLGTQYDNAQHEPFPTKSDQPRGTILKVRRRGYKRTLRDGRTVIFRFAKVMVSDRAQN